jgi:preprotein translocase subunit YajC
MSPLHLLLLVQDTAPADPAPASPGGFSLIPILLILGIFYVVLILPERKKQKQRQAMLSALAKGDRVMTSSGLYGTVVQLSDEVVTLQVAEGVRLRFARQAIQTLEGEPSAAAPSGEVPSQA